jgi:hypothetical protein
MDLVSPSVLKVLTPLLKPVAQWALGWLAGFRSPQAIALRRYQRRLGRAYGTFTPRSGLAGQRLRMQDRYLPLQVQHPGSARRLSIRQAITDHRQLIVVGEPGAGKSMLLHNLAFEFATDRRAATRENIPVIVELQSLQDDLATPLENHLLDRLKGAGFFRAEKFAKRALRTGQLRVLLDGLDEVAQAHRANVTRRILDFVREYPDCDVVITCRLSVREEALWRQLHVVQVAELDDQLIRHFVGTWLGREQPSTGLLLEELFANRGLLALARIPLLLTMMVTMYAGEHQPPVRLPASRARFYQQAIDFLLTPSHVEQTTDRDRIRDKRQVLRRLALTGLTAGGGDWLTVHHETAVGQATALLKEKNRAARELLREIVERSGLLRWSDEGYQFAHLSFQEFLAAEELRDDPRRLLDLFRGDPDRWRETAVLWCGFARDPTGVVEGLLRDRTLVVLECLSEVHVLDGRIVRAIIESFRGQLEHAGAASRVVRAFGVAASGSSDAARTVFDFLAGEVEYAQSPGRRAAAAHALAMSHIQPAAVLLGRLYGRSPEVREPLERMRDFAIEALTSAARSGDGRAFESLRAIGTPAAVHALVGLLWIPDDHVAAHAAWVLAAMLPLVEPDLATCVLTDKQPMVSHYRWVWEPFTQDQTTRRIVTRIAYLLKEGLEPRGLADGPPIDGRLAIALGFVGGGVVAMPTSPINPEVRSVLEQMERVSGRRDLISPRRIWRPFAGILEPSPHTEWAALQRRFILAHVRALGWGGRELRLLSHAPTELLVEMLLRNQQRAPSKDDWRLMFRKGPGLWPAAAACGLAAAAELVWLVVLAIVQTSRSFFPPGGFHVSVPSWLIDDWRTVWHLVGIGWDWSWARATEFVDFLHRNRVFGIDAQWVALGVAVIIALLALAAASTSLADSVGEFGVMIGLGALYVVGTLLVLLFLIMPAVWLHATTGTWWVLVPVWLFLIAATGTALILGFIQVERDENPLKGWAGPRPTLSPARA